MANRYWVGGSGTWNATSTTNWSATPGGAGGASTPTAADSVFFDQAATYTVTLSASPRCLDITVSAGTVTFSSTGTLAVSGSMSLIAGTVWSATGILTFNATTTDRTITTNGTTLACSITFNGVGVWALGSTLTTGISTITTLTSGTLNLGSYALITPRFSSSNTNTRTIAFGTGNITVNGTSTVWTTSTSTNLTTTGTRIVNVPVNSITTVTTGSLNEANSISFNFTAGTDNLSLIGTMRDVDFTGYAGQLDNDTRTIFGNLTLSAAMKTFQAGTGATTFAATSGSKTITTNGKLLPFPIEFDGIGGTWVLQDAMTLTNGFLTHINGTLDLNGKTLTVDTSYRTAAGTKNLTFNGGTLSCPGISGTAFNNAFPTGYTTTAGTGTGTISMTAATAKTFVGGGSTFNCTLNQGGAGALTITGNNTFNNITNTVQPASVLFTAGATTVFNNFNLRGTLGNLITISSSSAATHTLSKSSGTVSGEYLAISYSIAQGGASWNAVNSSDDGNNTGWIFTVVGPIGVALGNGLTIGSGINFTV